MRSLEVWSAGILLAVLAFGLALIPLLTPAFTRALSARYSTVPQSQSVPLAEATRTFVVSGSSESRVTLSTVMTRDAISHLDDVRGVIRGGNVVTTLLSVLFVIWVGARLAWGRTDVVAAALRVGAIAAAIAVILPAAIAVIDFDSFFSAFHGVFFKPGTWVFPSDSLLIRLFPEFFWTTAAVSWGALILLVAALYAVAARMIERRGDAGTEDGVSHVEPE